MWRRLPGTCLCLISVGSVNVCTSLSLSVLPSRPSLSYFGALSFNLTLISVFNCSASLCLPSFPFLLFPLSDKAPGQRECDTSIDNINKCIRDIEQASLAAVSQNLPSRDDISLEVNDRQTMTRHFPPTATCMPLCLNFLVQILLFMSITHFFFFPNPCWFDSQIVFSS